MTVNSNEENSKDFCPTYFTLHVINSWGCMLKYIVSCISTCISTHISTCISYPDRYRNSLSWDTVPALLDVMVRYIHHNF